MSHESRTSGHKPLVFAVAVGSCVLHAVTGTFRNGLPRTVEGEVHQSGGAVWSRGYRICERPRADFGLAVFFDPEQLPRTDLGLEGTPWCAMGRLKGSASALPLLTHVSHCGRVQCCGAGVHTAGRLQRLRMSSCCLLRCVAGCAMKIHMLAIFHCQSKRRPAWVVLRDRGELMKLMHG